VQLLRKLKGLPGGADESLFRRASIRAAMALMQLTKGASNKAYARYAHDAKSDNFEHVGVFSTGST
jgi:hypothetical protein